MELPDALRDKGPAEQEEWFLTVLEKDPLPVDLMLTVLRGLWEKGQYEKADTCADLLQEALGESDQRDALIEVLGLRCDWYGETPVWRAACHAAAKAGFKDRLGAAFVKSAGFEDELPTAECVRRLGLLNRLGDGVLCYDNTWGFGVVRQVDDFYEKVTIDFTTRPRHQMSFRYAAETLALIDDSHLYARRYRDPEGTAALAASDPAALVRIALASYGPLNAVELQERLVSDFVAEADWKSFWDRARKDLKGDPKVDFPSRRTEPIRLRERAREFDAAWFGSLAEVRDMERILARLETYREESDDAALDTDGQRVAADRLGFVAHGAEGRHPDLMARAILMAHAFGIAEADTRLVAAEQRLFDPAGFLAAADAVPARELAPLIRLLWRCNPDAALPAFLHALDKVKFSVVSHLLDFLEEVERMPACTEVMRASLRSRTPGLSLVLWACRHPDRFREVTGMGTLELLTAAVGGLEQEAAGEELRSQNQLRKLFEDPAWLRGVLGTWDAGQRMAFMKRIVNSRGWDPTGRRSMMARLIKLYPELHDAVSGDAEAPSGAADTARHTSWRSYKERQQQLRKLIEVDIPANSREIAVARSYGDLRENFEYQAAKDQQRILMQRQREWEQDLQQVRGTDFSGFPTDRCGIGTKVVLAGPDGRERSFCILGEWDRDEALGIIASGSRVARDLAGKQAGDEVRLVSDSGEESWTVKQIEGLPEEVLAWIDTPLAAGGAG